MKVNVVDRDVCILEAKFSLEQGRALAWEKRMVAFGALARALSLFGKPSVSEFVLESTASLYLPFWRIAWCSRFDYDRDASIECQRRPEVQVVTIGQRSFNVKAGGFSFDAVEHCVENFESDQCVSGLGQNDDRYRMYLDLPCKRLPAEQIERFRPADAEVVAPRVTASALIRDQLADFLRNAPTKGARLVREESLELTHLNLWLRPVRQFSFRWVPKDKCGTLTYDAVSGEVEAGGISGSETIVRFLSSDIVQEVGKEALQQLIQLVLNG
ncbi:MAG: hypothetical protein FJ109_19575 [Deltaproteobacteria bacterium]|nr:hypothetical protein [Deltaproteobacteria bacterium]